MPDPMQRLTFDAAPGDTFSDAETRTIRGLAIPADATAIKGGRNWKFKAKSVRFNARTPLLEYHDPARPVGRLTASTWNERGLNVTLAVSKTPAGDSALQLAADGILALSLGIDVLDGGARQVGEDFVVSKALATEISLTPVPAFVGSVLDSVSLSATEGTTVPDTDTTEVAVVPATVDLATLTAAFSAAMQPAAAVPVQAGPTPVPVTGATFVSEAAPYRFDGIAGSHGFVADARDSSQGSGEAGERLSKFLTETFAVTQANVSTLNPVQHKPEMYVGPLRWGNRPLAAAISTGSISNNIPFIFPKFSSAGNLVAPHVEGVEPTLATFTATSQTVTPKALSGKAELTREVFDAGGNPQVDALVWAEMLNAHTEAAEARIETMLAALTPTQIPVTGTDANAVDDLVSALVSLQYEKGGARFTSLVAHEELYLALANAKDSTGRKLLPVIGATNADGTRRADGGTIAVGGATAVPAYALTTSSYLIVPGSVWQWTSVPQKLTFDIAVASVFIGLFAYSAEAVSRDADVRELTYSGA